MGDRGALWTSEAKLDSLEGEDGAKAEKWKNGGAEPIFGNFAHRKIWKIDGKNTCQKKHCLL